MSRMDMFLMYEGIIEKWKLKAERIINRVVFDHCLILIKSKVLNWGPIPFKKFGAWMQHYDFLKKVE